MYFYVRGILPATNSKHPLQRNQVCGAVLMYFLAKEYVFINIFPLMIKFFLPAGFVLEDVHGTA